MKRWTMEEDIFLHEHFDAVGDFIGVHDLGRPPKSATRRVVLLKKSGQWDALTRMKSAERDYRIIAKRKASK
jgi:hypothetical protein